jgi:hypothetical protein
MSAIVRSLRRPLAVAAFVLAAVVSMSACSSSSRPAAVAPATTPPATTTTVPSATTTTALGLPSQKGTVGSTFSSYSVVDNYFDAALNGGIPYTVTLTRVFDPAHGTDTGPASPSDRLVAIMFVVTDTSSDLSSDDTGASVTLVGSNGHDYTDANDDVAECPTFDQMGGQTLSLEMSSRTGPTALTRFGPTLGVSSAEPVALGPRLDDVGVEGDPVDDGGH